jgi:hypothetical protein
MMNRTLRYPHQFLGLNLQDCHPHRSVVMKMMMRWNFPFRKALWQMVIGLHGFPT